ncbi:hypothetical protein [Ensifer aridi]|uniref:hypothetical protein n=1 Tax=Ensifer aridi TaxID=1708715 RepID=UPI0015E41C07|nr:hypothetical protein [Ensifer aridi]
MLESIDDIQAIALEIDRDHHEHGPAHRFWRLRCGGILQRRFRCELRQPLKHTVWSSRGHLPQRRGLGCAAHAIGGETTGDIIVYHDDLTKSAVLAYVTSENNADDFARLGSVHSVADLAAFGLSALDFTFV